MDYFDYIKKFGTGKPKFNMYEILADTLRDNKLTLKVFKSDSEAVRRVYYLSDFDENEPERLDFETRFKKLAININANSNYESTFEYFIYVEFLIFYLDKEVIL